MVGATHCTVARMHATPTDVACNTDDEGGPPCPGKTRPVTLQYDQIARLLVK
jgi:hypothetical protein